MEMYLLLSMGGIISFLMAFAIGAQDVANALGTSVGSKALTLKQAVLIGGIFEFLGSMCGGQICTTIATGIIPPLTFASHTQFMLVMVTTLMGALIWLMIATVFSLPVSTTHSLVGSLIGITGVSVGLSNINEAMILRIITSWVLSPFLGFGIAFGLLYYFNRYLGERETDTDIINIITPKRDIIAPDLEQGEGSEAPNKLFSRCRERKWGLLYASANVLLLTFLLLNLPFNSYLNHPLRLSILVTCFLLSYIYMSRSLSRSRSDYKRGYISIQVSDPALKPLKSLPKGDDVGEGEIGEMGEMGEISPDDQGPTECSQGKLNTSSEIEQNTLELGVSTSRNHQMEISNKVFKYLMIETACLVGFAHGQNDVSNAIGPFIAIHAVYKANSFSALNNNVVPNWILLFGATGIICGLAIFG